ncbi:hypothetical protein ACFOD0_07590 [Shewanella intestini]|uniref:Uncharacterized protein n=1 Tax=Shewanella intestini TaxID=2017544 RepID=A0ABS5HY82_9GAMM|nr:MULTISPECIES: hypothetical protein [Shewanella]MBR9726737.1 hypothetical protein [Shewanella intestini]MRG34697.1 hypothetical protein [Shewanella sp. XMDDZSB0408]
MRDVPNLLIDIAQISAITTASLNPALLSLLISYIDQNKWLSNPKMTLIEYGPAQHKLATPHAVLTSELILADKQHAPLHDSFSYDINGHFANDNHKANSNFSAPIESSKSLLARNANSVVLIAATHHYRLAQESYRARKH